MKIYLTNINFIKIIFLFLMGNYNFYGSQQQEQVIEITEENKTSINKNFETIINQIKEIEINLNQLQSKNKQLFNDYVNQESSFFALIKSFFLIKKSIELKRSIKVQEQLQYTNDIKQFLINKNYATNTLEGSICILPEKIKNLFIKINSEINDIKNFENFYNFFVTNQLELNNFNMIKQINEDILNNIKKFFEKANNNNIKEDKVNKQKFSNSKFINFILILIIIGVIVLIWYNNYGGKGTTEEKIQELE